ncbi:Crp/Fnr family transcriptional regulator [Pseudoxanthomonas sp. CF125]|uniref:Crp/Fnr family transcriptional regulator n=1 Tax=Pseudoxanthomonas sp. CF125 TaxID=1855303 RepID=UPI00159FD8A0|nr:Crp/Fnr family transcriptional regulator [Pseudoxanthomonas sp. CF125]
MPAERADTLSPELLSQLAQCGDAKWYARNQMLIVEGEVSDALYILIAGQLKVFTQDSKGRELVYNILQPGEFFGELFLDGGLRSASVKAVVDSQCIVIDELAIRGFMKTYPEFAECLVYKLIARLRHATQLSKSLALHDVYERTVDLLNQVALNEPGDIRIVPSSMTQQEIADRVGATREMINHILRDLTRGGFLARDEKKRLVFTKMLPKRW